MAEKQIHDLFDSKEDPAEKTAYGFSASMSGLNLFDFVQMECLTGGGRAIRVTSGNRIGYLFFKSGAVTHALTPDSQGEAAALQILRWTDGQLEQCTLHPDEQASIRRPWQQLLLRAAQVEDEARRDNLVAFPQRHQRVAMRSDSGVSQQFKSVPAATGSERPSDQASSGARVQPGTMRSPGVRVASTVAGSQANGDGVLGAARIEASGELLSARGDSSDLPGLAAFALRLAELIGGSLGIEQLKTIDARLEHTRCAIKREANGAAIIVRALTRREAPPADAAVGSRTQVSRATLNSHLSGLKDVEHVLGSFLLGPSGILLGIDLPCVFDESVVAEASGRLLRLREALEAPGDRLRSLELRFGQQRLYLRTHEASLLAVLTIGDANMPLLEMALAVLLRKLAATQLLAGQPTEKAQAATQRAPDAANLEASSLATKRPQTPPGAPASTKSIRSARPVYYRGRRVE